MANAYYVDKSGAYQEFLQIFGNDPDMIDALENPSALPTSIRIELSDIELYQSVEFRLQQYPQLIQRISSAAQEIEQISAVSNADTTLVINGPNGEW